jgi:hypothetical protein
MIEAPIYLNLKLLMISHYVYILQIQTAFQTWNIFNFYKLIVLPDYIYVKKIYKLVENKITKMKSLRKTGFKNLRDLSICKLLK